MSSDHAALQQYEALSQERKALQAIGHLPSWYNTPAWQMFKKSYIYEDEAALLGRHQTIAKTLARHMVGQEAEWEERFFNELWDGILSPSTPPLSNTGTDRGMIVSCSGQKVGDSVESFYDTYRETALLSKWGFGTSADISAIRARGASISRGGKASGPVEVANDLFNTASKISQGGNRRGQVAVYLDIEHANWDEACDSLAKDPDGKNYGWIVRDSFVERLKANDEDACRRWIKCIYTKLITGKGYIFCVDKANRHRPQMYKDHGLDIVASNLCSEIMLHSSEEYTYSCILSSLNLYHWDRISTTESAFTAMVFLDCMTSEFIDKSAGIRGLEKVRNFTIKGRAVGLGVMGFHTYLQSKRIPYIGLEAQFLSTGMARHMHDETLRASQFLAQRYGEPEWCKGYGVRNTHRTASPPTKSTANLMGGVSESWFPDPGMVFDAELASGGVRRIIPEFHKRMIELGVYNPDTIRDIIQHLGSVQHVSWLPEAEKPVWLNAFEMDQEILFRHHVKRQPWICQGQSLNFYVPGESSEELIARLMTKVLTHPDCLSQYYIYSRNGVVVKDECISCQG